MRTPEEVGRLYVYSDMPGLALYFHYVPDKEHPENNHFEFSLYQDGAVYCRGSLSHWFCIPMERQFREFSQEIIEMYRDGTLPKPNASTDSTSKL